MRIDPASPVPIFQQILEGLCAKIAAGVYRPGELVPSVRQQALALVVNPNTVQRAYEQLERGGLLVARRGSGMEVAGNAPDLAAERVAEVVRASFASAIRAGQSGSMPKTRIDGLYRKAWDERDKSR